ncbi:hypothetical protein [Streptomyces sp. AK08-02]|uniref:hypothetical protein n=1 Tax=Streptomyces sp. AK08-02 TaxID=3028654 RepID=UPI0029AAFC2F|nr:hypothetical protein [Streptomyces sp. AK08-02]MDX3746433.1 hypothetical protein [Streptomyces sp. AK08-02]
MPRRPGGGTCRGTRTASAKERAESVGAPRLLRAAVFSAVCVVTTALGHALMSGDLLPWWTLVLAFTGAASGAWWLTGRERGAVTVVGATAVAQGLLHLLFDVTHTLVRPAGGVPGAESTTGMDHGMAFSHSGMAVHMDHSVSGMAMQHAGTTGAPVPLPLESALAGQGSAGMFLVHLLAAVVCGLWLWRGETAAYRLGRAFAVALFAPLRRVRRMLARTMRDGWTLAGGPAEDAAETSPSVPTVLRHAVVRRGPPGAGSALIRLSPGPLLALRP